MNKHYKLYEVGGCIRDEILGIKSGDVDYSFVWDNPNAFDSVEDAYNTMNRILEADGFRVYKTHPDCFTTKAKFPEDHQYEGDADFVMARKEVGYIEGTRTPIVEVGTLEDDLSRRDFTVNALAKGEDGKIIDLYGGKEDLEIKILSTPLDPEITFNDDPLRILRGLRFSVTKGFHLGMDEIRAIENFDVSKMKVVSVERKMAELTKMFKHSTKWTLHHLEVLKIWNKDLWLDLIENEQGMWLMPTNKKK